MPARPKREESVMLPSADDEFSHDIPANAMFWTPDEEEHSEGSGLGYFHDVWDIGELDHAEAAATVAEESRIIDLVQLASRDPSDFERIAKAVEWQDPEYLPEGFSSRPRAADIMDVVGDGDDGPRFDGLELGVAGLVMALTAFGCITAASCRGHSVERPWAPFPIAFFAADRLQARRLQPMVAAAGCGFDIDDERPRPLWVGGPSIRHTSALAHLVLECCVREPAARRPPDQPPSW